jgi:hypothetical protein
MLQHLYDLISSYWSWLIGIAGLSALLSWIPGGGAAIAILTSALQMAASAFQMLSPIINAMINGVVWIWSNVIFPGLLHIFESWATIFTVLLMGSFLWVSLISDYKVRTATLQHRLNVCLSETKQSGRKVQEQEPEPENNSNFSFPNIFNWKW